MIVSSLIALDGADELVTANPRFPYRLGSARCNALTLSDHGSR
jgi:hypothetical protein